MVEFDITVNGNEMFDYNIYHNYRQFQGIVSLILGIVMLFVCIFSIRENANITYILISGFMGVYFTILTPIRIRIKSFEQVKKNPSFRKPIHYIINKDEIILTQDDVKNVIPMNTIVKAADTGKSILLYTSILRAFILPKDQIGDNLNELKDIIKNSEIRKNKIK